MGTCSTDVRADAGARRRRHSRDGPRGRQLRPALGALCGADSLRHPAVAQPSTGGRARQTSRGRRACADSLPARGAHRSARRWSSQERPPPSTSRTRGDAASLGDDSAVVALEQLRARIAARPEGPRRNRARTRLSQGRAADHLVLGDQRADRQRRTSRCGGRHAYRARWVIEEFFKALKTGCQIERRQMESYKALRIALALFLPIAVRLLALRDAARTEPERPCSALTPTLLQLLRTCGRNILSATPTNREVYSALAALGGHLRSNGEPGWIVLGRAYEKLLVLEQGWLAARAAGDPIDD